jgi:ribosomal protein L37AE/L43A
MNGAGKAGRIAKGERFSSGATDENLLVRSTAPDSHKCPKCGSEMVKIDRPDEDADAGMITWWVCTNETKCGHEEKLGGGKE